MKKNKSEFPWYLIYVPIFTLLVIDWCLDGVMEDKPMGLLEKFLTWLGLNGQLVTCMIIICAGLLALGYIVVRWFFTSKVLHNIEAVSNTAPGNLENTIKNTGNKICEKIDGQDSTLILNLAEIKSSTSAVQRQIENLSMYRQSSPVQMSALIGGIAEMYAQHDRDQKTIESLQNEIAELKRRNQELENTLLQRDPGNGSRTQDDWEPEY